MKFQLNVTITDQDYLEYNVFWMLRSPYGKRQMRSVRLMTAAVVVLLMIVFLWQGGFSVGAWIAFLLMAAVLGLSQIFMGKFFALAMKRTLKSLKKSGKMGYSPKAILEFYEDHFAEITPENKTEQRYSALERVSVVDGKTVYLHVNNVMAYLLPVACFASEEELTAFLEFIRGKCTQFDSYE